MEKANIIEALLIQEELTTDLKALEAVISVFAETALADCDERISYVFDALDSLVKMALSKNDRQGTILRDKS